MRSVVFIVTLLTIFDFNKISAVETGLLLKLTFQKDEFCF